MCLQHTALMPRKPYFIQLTDTHLFEDPAARLWDVAPDPMLDKTLEMLASQAPDPDLVLLTGDLSADGSPQSYRRLKDKLAPLRAPMYFVPGNHDDRVQIAKIMSGRRMNAQEKLTSAFDAFGWRFILLDSAVAGEDRGSIGPDQCNWLAATLHASVALPTIVAMHHNPLPVGSAWLDTMTVADGQPLLSILDAAKQVKLVLFGHIHQEFALQRDGKEYLSAPSTFFQFQPHSAVFAQDPSAAAGARVVEVGDHTLRTAVLRVGQPAPAMAYLQAR